MREVILILLGFFIGMGGAKVFDQVVPYCFFVLGVFGLIAFFIMDFKSKKPKIEFGKLGIGTGFGDNFSSWYIPIRNKRLDGWRSYICKRSEVVECQVQVRFMIGDKVLANAIWWNDLPVSKTLLADSNWHNIPLVHETDASGELLLLAGTSAATSKSNIPPHIVPTETDIMAIVQITSRGEPKGESKWRIYLAPLGLIKVTINRVDKLNDL